MDLLAFPFQEIEVSPLKELQKLFKASSEMIDNTLQSTRTKCLPGNEKIWSEVKVHLEKMKQQITDTNVLLQTFLDGQPQARRQSVAKIYRNPMVIPTPQSCEYNTEAGRAKFEKMSIDELHRYFMTGIIQTREVRKEIELYLRRNFPPTLVHPSVIRRCIVVIIWQNSFKLFKIEDWLFLKKIKNKHASNKQKYLIDFRPTSFRCPLALWCLMLGSTRENRESWSGNRLESPRLDRSDWSTTSSARRWKKEFWKLLRSWKKACTSQCHSLSSSNFNSSIASGEKFKLKQNRSRFFHYLFYLIVFDSYFIG